MQMPISLLPGLEMKPTLRVPIHKQLMIKLIVTIFNGSTGRPLLRLRADLPEPRGEVIDGEVPSMIGTILLLDLTQFDIVQAFLRERPPILATRKSSPFTSLSVRWRYGWPGASLTCRLPSRRCYCRRLSPAAMSAASSPASRSPFLHMKTASSTSWTLFDLITPPTFTSDK